MATYNGERFLPEMLESLAAQTRPPDELVVRDDASRTARSGCCMPSPGGCLSGSRSMAGDRRLGYAQNFIAASQACKGNVVFFADQDDSWRPPKVATVTQVGYADARRWPSSTTSP